MSKPSWVRPLIPEEDKLLTELSSIKCEKTMLRLFGKDCHESTYSTTMCDSCKKFWDAAAEMFGIDTETMIKEYLADVINKKG